MAGLFTPDSRKSRLAALDKFLSAALLTLELIPVPTDETEPEAKIRDIQDRPILRAAIEAKADVLLTGDTAAFIPKQRKKHL